MFRPNSETRPVCNWPSHKWKLLLYRVITDDDGLTLFVVEELECLNCGCLKLRKL